MNILDLSVIVPCYNVESYLPRCIDSILSQTIANAKYEIILVDDASTDSTWDIIKEYEKKYPDMITAIHCEENGRQGRARNIGLEYSIGEYVGFVDSDDWIEADMYESMLQEAKIYNSDVVHCEYIRDSGVDNDSLSGIGTGQIRRLLIDSDDKRKEFIVSSCIGYGCVTDIIKKSILLDNNIMFPEKLAYEDLYWRSMVYLYVNRVSLIDKKYYHYFINYQSTVLKKNETYHMDLMKINELKYQEYKKRGVFDKYREALEFDMLDTWYLCMIKMLVYRYDNEVSYDYFISLKTRIYELIPDANSNKYIEKNFSDIQKMLMKLLECNVDKKEYDEIIKIIKKIGI